MGGIPASAYKRLKSYWKRRRCRYERLNGPPDPVQSQDQARPSRRRWWSVKVGRKVRILRRVGSPKKWLTRLRDAYVKMMLSLGNSGLVSSGFGGGSMDYGFGFGFGRGPVKEYDEKVIVKIHKALVMAEQGGMVPRDPLDPAPPPHVNVLSAR